jgi:hypothetical protein
MELENETRVRSTCYNLLTQWSFNMAVPKTQGITNCRESDIIFPKYTVGQSNNATGYIWELGRILLINYGTVAYFLNMQMSTVFES